MENGPELEPVRLLRGEAEFPCERLGVLNSPVAVAAGVSVPRFERFGQADNGFQICPLERLVEAGIRDRDAGMLYERKRKT